MFSLMAWTEAGTSFPEDSGTIVRSTSGKKRRLSLAFVKSHAVSEQAIEAGAPAEVVAVSGLTLKVKPKST